jgi:hypothetical protein
MIRLSVLGWAGLSSRRWLLPYLSVLLVSAMIAYVMTSTLTRSGATPHGPRAVLQVASGADATGPALLADGRAGRDLGLPCAAMFGSYNWWVYSTSRLGVCGLELDAPADPPPSR